MLASTISMLFGRKPTKADPPVDVPNEAQIEDEPTVTQAEDKQIVTQAEDKPDEIVEARRKGLQAKADAIVGCQPQMEMIRKEFEILDRRDRVNTQLNIKMALVIEKYDSAERLLKRRKEQYDMVVVAHGTWGSREENHVRVKYEDSLIKFKDAATELEKQHAGCARTREMANAIHERDLTELYGTTERRSYFVR